MTTSEAIKTALSDKKVTQSKLAEMMGYASQAAIGNRLNSNISCELLIQMLDKLGYEVVVQPKTQGKRKDGAIVLEPSGIPDGRGKKRVKDDIKEGDSVE